MMADKSKIKWIDATWNPTSGCSVISPERRNCYALRLDQQRLEQPLFWNNPRRIFVGAQGDLSGDLFGDLFHEDVRDAWIDQIFAIMALCPQHIFQVLTKCARRMRDYMNRLSQNPDDRLGSAAAQFIGNDLLRRHVAMWINGRARWHDAPIDDNPLDGSQPGWPLPNVWLGVSLKDQTSANARIPDLLASPAALRFISAEPLLGPLDLRDWFWGFDTPCQDCPQDIDCTCWWELRRDLPDDMAPGHLDLMITGGESGPGARPMHPDWVRTLREQCTGADISFHFKQWGSWGPCEHLGDKDLTGLASGTWQDQTFTENPKGLRPANRNQLFRAGKKTTGRRLDGREWNERPG